MDVQQPYELPVEGIMDMATGLAVDVPLFRQVPPGWLEDHKEDYDRIVAFREKAGIEVEEDFPKMKVEKIEYKPRKNPPAPRKRLKDRR